MLVDKVCYIGGHGYVVMPVGVGGIAMVAEVDGVDGAAEGAGECSGGASAILVIRIPEGRPRIKLKT